MCYKNCVISGFHKSQLDLKNLCHFVSISGPKPGQVIQVSGQADPLIKQLALVPTYATQSKLQNRNQLSWLRAPTYITQGLYFICDYPASTPNSHHAAFRHMRCSHDPKTQFSKSEIDVTPKLRNFQDFKAYLLGLYKV